MATIFLSYANEDFDVAQKIFFALNNLNHKVFFDKQSLQIGEEYNSIITDNIRKSDFIIFLVSPEFCSFGSYCMTELKVVQQNWPVPKGKIFPVIVRETSFEIIPNYIKSVTIFSTNGNLIAEIVQKIQDKLMNFKDADSVTKKIRKLEVEQRLEFLNSNWDIKKKSYYINLDNKKVIPTYSLAATVGVACMAFSVFGYLFTNQDSEFFGTDQIFFTLFPALMGIISVIYIVVKSKNFQEAEKSYLEEKEIIIDELYKDA